MTADEIRTLFDYNYWANGKILTAAAGMGAEELSAPASLSHGSLLATLVHTLAVEWMWRRATFPRSAFWAWSRCG